MCVHPFQLTFEAKVKETQIVDMRLGVEVKIKDVNDNPPIFHPDRVEVTILESTAQGKVTVPPFPPATFSLHMHLSRQR